MANLRRILVSALGLCLLLGGLLALPRGSKAQDSAPPQSVGAYACFLPVVAVTEQVSVWLPTTWLEAVNAYRAAAKLPVVTECSPYSYGAWLHSRYMVKHDTICHSEDPASLWYTLEGAQAAAVSNLMVTTRQEASDLYALDMWMQAPFHAIGVIDPALQQVGFGSYREAIGTFRMGAALDVLRGRGVVPPGVSFPILYPGQGSVTPLLTFTSEYPSPLTSCPGYTAPSGPPIIVQMGTGGVTPRVTASSLVQGGVSLAHCVFDETSYTNPDANAQSLGRAILNSRDAIVMMPREPFVAGRQYAVSLTVNGVRYAWTFSTVTSGATAAAEVTGEPLRTVLSVPLQ